MAKHLISKATLTLLFFGHTFWGGCTMHWRGGHLK